jgi:hypothetical protein
MDDRRPSSVMGETQRRRGYRGTQRLLRVGPERELLYDESDSIRISTFIPVILNEVKDHSPTVHLKVMVRLTPTDPSLRSG